jgi:hypothetical protein
MIKALKATAISLPIVFSALLAVPGTAVATPAISAVTENGAQIDGCTSVAPPYWFDFIAAAKSPNACQKCVDQGRVFERSGWIVHCWTVSSIRVELWGYLLSPTGEHQSQLLPGVGQ